MRLLLHLVRTDVRAIRLPLAIYLLLHAVVVGLRGPWFDDWPHRPTESWPQVVLSLSATLLGWVLAARIVHADAPSGTTAWWPTRPVPWLDMVASKLTTIGILFIVVPACADLLVLVVNQVGTALAVRLAIERIPVIAFPLLPIVLVAALTRDAARLVLAMGVAALAGLAVARQASELAILTTPLGIWETRALPYSRLLLTVLLVPLGSAALIVEQYRTRRTSRMAGVAAALAVVAGLTWTVWPWAWWPDRGLVARPIPRERLDAGRVRVDMGSGSLTAAWRYATQRTNGGGTRVTSVQIEGVGRVEGLPNDWTPIVRSVRGALRSSRGTLDLAQTSTSDTWRGFSGIDRVMAHVLGVRTILNVRSSNRMALAQLTRAEFKAWQETTGEYRAAVDIEIARVRLGPVVPFRAHASTSVAGLVTVLAQDNAAPRGELRPPLLREKSPSRLLPTRVPLLVYVLRHRHRGEALVIGPRDSYGRAGESNSWESPLSVRWAGFWEFPRDRALVDEAWLDGAELVVLVIDTVGTLQTTLTIPDFVVPAIEVQ